MLRTPCTKRKVPPVQIKVEHRKHKEILENRIETMRKTQGKLEKRNRNIRKSQKKGIETMRKTIENIGKYLQKGKEPIRKNI